MTFKRISFIAAMLAIAVAAAKAPPAAAQSANDDPLSTASILRDPSIPALGNPKGDVTVVEYFDYQCPFCKKMNPMLNKIVHEDGHIRLVYKEWPIFGDISVYAARLALATRYQHKYAAAHEALITMKERLNKSNVKATLAKAGIDVRRAEHDLVSHRKEIDALLASNHEQAMALGFQGTPSFIIGHFRVPGALDEKNFKLAIADARAAEKQKTEKHK